MKKIILFTVCSILFTVHSYTQMPADSLKGTYAGIAYSKILSTDTWEIGPDTLFVVIIDTINCQAGVMLCGGQLIPLYTTYSYCITPVTGNYYAHFYGMDSLTAIADSNTIQPPCIDAFSVRFYGKRISSNYGVGIDEWNNKELLTVYPNPSSTILFIGYSMFNGAIPVQITDVTGQEIINVQMTSPQLQVDISGLSNGIYFVNVQTANGMLTKKIVVQR